MRTATQFSRLAWQCGLRKASVRVYRYELCWALSQKGTHHNTTLSASLGGILVETGQIERKGLDYAMLYFQILFLSSPWRVTAGGGLSHKWMAGSASVRCCWSTTGRLPVMALLWVFYLVNLQVCVPCLARCFFFSSHHTPVSILWLLFLSLVWNSNLILTLLMH